MTPGKYSVVSKEEVGEKVALVAKKIQPTEKIIFKMPCVRSHLY